MDGRALAVARREYRAVGVALRRRGLCPARDPSRGDVYVHARASTALCFRLSTGTRCCWCCFRNWMHCYRSYCLVESPCPLARNNCSTNCYHYRSCVESPCPLDHPGSGRRSCSLALLVARAATSDVPLAALAEHSLRSSVASLLAVLASSGMDRAGSPFHSRPNSRPALPRVARPARGAGTRSRPRGMGRGARCRGLRAATQRARDEERNERSDVSTAVGWGGSWPRLGGLKGAVHGGYAAVSSGSFASR